MRRDKIVARILIIFSVVDVVLAAPAAVRQGHLGVAEDVTAALVKRGQNLASTSGKPPQLPPPGLVGSMPEGMTPAASDEESYWSSSASSTSSAGEPLHWPQSEASNAALKATKASDEESYWSSSPSDSSSEGELLQWPQPGQEGSRLEPPEDSDLFFSAASSSAGEPLHLPQPEASNAALKATKAILAMGAVIGISAGVIYGIKNIQNSSSRGYAPPLLRPSPADNLPSTNILNYDLSFSVKPLVGILQVVTLSLRSDTPNPEKHQCRVVSLIRGTRICDCRVF